MSTLIEIDGRFFGLEIRTGSGWTSVVADEHPCAAHVLKDQAVLKRMARGEVVEVDDGRSQRWWFRFQLSTERPPVPAHALRVMAEGHSNAEIRSMAAELLAARDDAVRYRRIRACRGFVGMLEFATELAHTDADYDAAIDKMPAKERKR